MPVSVCHGANEVVNLLKKLQMANELKEVNHSKYEHHPVQDDHDLCPSFIGTGKAL